MNRAFTPVNSLWRSKRDMAIWLLFFLFSAAYFIFAAHLPVSIFTEMPHDDGLFFKNAFSISSGQWLGPYDRLTLTKGPAFPLFLALNHALGFSITFSIALLYWLACTFLIATLRRFKLNARFALTIFVALLFIPALFPMRIIRDNIYPALSLLLFVASLQIVFFTAEKKLYTCFQVVSWGVIAAAFWLTREEGVWILPSLVVLVVLRLWAVRQDLKKIKSLIGHGIGALSISVLLLLGVAAINFNVYGIFETVDFKSSSFSRAIGALSSVHVGEEKPFLPVSFEKREKIYEISPSFAKLKNYFENTGKGWTQHGCRYYPETCNDYAFGWFVWALRDAVASQGLYTTPVQAETFYKDLIREIKAACALKKISCESGVLPFISGLTKEQLKAIPDEAWSVFKLATLQEQMWLTSPPSQGASVEKFHDYLGRPELVQPTIELPKVFSKELTVHIKGWYVSPDLTWIKLSCPDGTPEGNILQLESSDLIAAFQDQRFGKRRFSFDAHPGCTLLAENGGNIKIKDIFGRAGTGYKNSRGAHIHFDEITLNGNDGIAEYEKFAFWLEIKAFLIELYKFLLPFLAYIGGSAFILVMMKNVTKKKRVSPLFIITAALWALFFSRVLLLALLGVTSFPIAPLYVYPISPILCLAGILSIALLFMKDESV